MLIVVVVPVVVVVWYYEAFNNNSFRPGMGVVACGGRNSTRSVPHKNMMYRHVEIVGGLYYYKCEVFGTNIGIRVADTSPGSNRTRGNTMFDRTIPFNTCCENLG